MIRIPFIEKLLQRSVVGMDVGQGGVKFARIEPREGVGPLEVTVFRYPGNILEEQESEAASFHEFLQTNRLVGVAVACSFEDPSLKIRRVDLPKMPEQDLREAVAWQLRDVVEGSLADFIVRHSLIEEVAIGDLKRLSLVAYAIGKKAIVDRINLLKKFGFKPVVIEPTSVSLLAAYDFLKGWGKNQYYGLLDLGESKAVFTVMKTGRLYFSRSLTGISLSQLRSQLGKDVTSLSQEGDVTIPELASFYSRLAVETQRSIDNFSLLFKKNKSENVEESIGGLALCGGGGSLPGVAASLMKNLAMPTDVLDPSLGGRISIHGSDLPGHFFDVALGLALYGRRLG